MRKSILAVTATLMLAATAAQAQDYRQATRDAQRQSWENAGMGIALNAAGALVGAAVGAIIQPSGSGQPGAVIAPGPQAGYAPPPGYAGTPTVVNPYYYPQAQACMTARAPVYDAYGRVVEFIQYCANPAR